MIIKMEQGNIGLPGLGFLGCGVFFQTIFPTTLAGWLSAISFLCSGIYYVYMIYSQYKKNKNA